MTALKLLIKVKKSVGYSFDLCSIERTLRGEMRGDGGFECFDETLLRIESSR